MARKPAPDKQDPDKHELDQSRQTPPAADPRAGSKPGYAENQPRDRADARAPGPKPQPSPDEPGMDRDTDEQADPAKE